MLRFFLKNSDFFSSICGNPDFLSCKKALNCSNYTAKQGNDEVVPSNFFEENTSDETVPSNSPEANTSSALVPSSANSTWDTGLNLRRSS